MLLPDLRAGRPNEAGLAIPERLCKSYEGGEVEMDLSRRTVKVLLLAFLLLAGCATPYGERDFRGVGYSDVQLEPNVYALDYSGDGHHSPPVLTGYWHRRAKELCPNGYEVKESPQFLSQSSGGIYAGGLLFMDNQSAIHGTIRCLAK
jgi:hypothetical protein